MIHFQNLFYDLSCTPKEPLLSSYNLSPSHFSLSSRDWSSYHPNESPPHTGEQLGYNSALAPLFFRSIVFLVTGGFWTVAISFEDSQPTLYPRSLGAYIFDPRSFSKAIIKETLVCGGEMYKVLLKPEAPSEKPGGLVQPCCSVPPPEFLTQ